MTAVIITAKSCYRKHHSVVFGFACSHCIMSVTTICLLIEVEQYSLASKHLVCCINYLMGSTGKLSTRWPRYGAVESFESRLST
jgi:hypothetical protein